MWFHTEIFLVDPQLIEVLSKMSLPTLLLFALTALMVVHCSSAEEDPELEMNYLPVANVRTDPIISQTCLSDHVHTFYGPPLVRPDVTTDELIASASAQHTGNVEENKSLYWHPAVYRFNKATKTFTLDTIHYFSV